MQPQDINDAQRRLKPLQAAITCGDFGAFESALFGGTDHVITRAMAEDLAFGFESNGAFRNSISLANLCVAANQPRMLVAALEATHPDMVFGLSIGNAAAWTQQLCTVIVYTGTRFHRESAPLQLLADSHRDSPGSDDFLALAFRFDPDNEDAHHQEQTNAAFAARMNAARMRLQVNSTPRPSDASASNRTHARP